MDQARTANARVIIGVATLLGCFSALLANQYVLMFAETKQSFLVLLGLNLGYWYGWAALAPLVLWLARRFPFDRQSWRRSLPVHVAAVMVVTFAHVVLSESTYMLIMQSSMGTMPKDTFWHGVWRTYVKGVDWEMATYWALIGLSHAVAYYHQAQDRTLRASQLETQLAAARLQALQRQLHPHFLFNTLNAISALMHRDVDAADQMLTRLSDLLRMALDHPGAQEIPLKDELDFLEKYLEIEQARFGERLTVRFDVEPETLDALVPNLVLQPLVENSIRHAIGARIEPGTIEVRTRRSGSVLELQVRDNGPGLVAAARPGKGVGLANTRLRLEHLYGPAGQLALSEPPGGGVIASVTLPFRSDLEDQDDVAGDAEHAAETEHIKGVA